MIFFRKAFTAFAYISPFLKNQVSMLHLEGEVLNLLIAIIMDAFGLSAAIKAGLHGRIGFNKYPYIMICMNNFSNDCPSCISYNCFYIIYRNTLPLTVLEYA